MRSREGRPLVLAGVTIPDDRGLVGHSDADLVCHAVTDALLGAAGGEDIGATVSLRRSGVSRGPRRSSCCGSRGRRLAAQGWRDPKRRCDRDHAGTAAGSAPRAHARVAGCGPRDVEVGAGDGAGVDHRPPWLRRARGGRGLPRGGAAGAVVTAAGVVSFDLDETLWEFLPMMDGALRATLAALDDAPARAARGDHRGGAPSRAGAGRRRAAPAPSRSFAGSRFGRCSPTTAWSRRACRSGW